MNGMNSLIIEGKITKADDFSKVVDLETTRYYKDADGNKAEEKSIFPCVIPSSLYSLVKVGKEIRAVGRLKQYRWTSADGKLNSSIGIIAEHIEVKN